MHVNVDVAILTWMNSYVETTEAKRQHRTSSEQLLTEVRDLEKTIGCRGFWEESELTSAEFSNIFLCEQQNEVNLII